MFNDVLMDSSFQLWCVQKAVKKNLADNQMTVLPLSQCTTVFIPIND